tara:strand:- start:8760 stop:9137 length:378 start_codon:yes stop_codon:yes gene_type:complete
MQINTQDADREFHLTIAEASGNAAVKHVVESLWQIRTEVPAVQEVHSAICAVEKASDRHLEHADVLNALRERDPAAARQAMQAHFRGLLVSMIDVTEEKAIEDLKKKTTESRQRYLTSIAHSRSA